VGETVAKKLVAHFRTIEALKHASVEELVAVDEIGERIAESVLQYFSDPAQVQQINKLKQAGLNFESSSIEKIQEGENLKGLSFVISGVFGNFSREELKELIEKNGGKVGSSVSSKTDYLIAGENMGPAKLKKANSLGITIISEEEFVKLIS
jgi:DNA ligase (NAD+)